MKKPLVWLCCASALPLLLSLGVAASAQGRDERGCAILPPYESPDPPGFNSANGDIDRKGGFYPYYSPLVAISCRWGYKELIPYYPGYCRKSRHAPNRCGGAGCDDGVPVGAVDASTGAAFTYGAFTGRTANDDNVFWRMGGNGLVPYGDPQSPRPGPDLIDLIQAHRGGPGCP